MNILFEINDVRIFLNVLFMFHPKYMMFHMFFLFRVLKIHTQGKRHEKILIYPLQC